MNPRIKEILEEMVPVGVLGKVHGLHGELKFTPFTNVLQIIEGMEEVFLYSEEKGRGFFLRVESIRAMPKKILLKFFEFDTREDAEVLEGFKVYVRRDELPKLGEDEYYYEEVYDCKVYEEGEDIGKVVDIIETGSNEVLVVEKDGKERLIPVIKDYIEEIDTKNKRIRVRKMEWI